MTSYPAPSPAGPPPGPAPRQKRSPAGKILIIIGAVILLGALVTGGILAFAGIGGVVKDASGSTVIDSGQGSVELTAGDVRTLYYDSSQGSPICTITGPDGAEPANGGFQSSTITVNGTEWRSLENFEVTASGEHEISCDGGPVMVAPPVSIGGIFAGVGGILLAVLGGGLGVLVLVVGIVLHVALKPKG
ncbi:hypothetical protein [Brachybacterium hainanense]|uniref:DUF4307 domain-containing protein n=1 Tax=Brachybacterium hainanense TaxID=1541174 RepID=A0ABV6RAM1_9MICO